MWKEGAAHNRLCFIFVIAAALIAAASILVLSDDSDARTIIKGDYYYEVVSEEEHLVDLSNISMEKSGTVSVPAYITDNDVDYTVVGIGENACKDRKLITHLSIPTTVTSIGANAFNGCSKLYTVTGLTNVSSIGGYAFAGCSLLDSIDLPSGITAIESYTFYNCAGMGGITIPDTVTRIEEHAFDGCASLTRSELPENLEKIGDYAFHGCSRILSVQIPDTVTYLGIGAYSECGSLIYASLPDTIIELKGNLFMGCTSIAVVDMSDDVEMIGSNAFYNCINLRSITISDKVDFIGSFAFYGMDFYDFDGINKITNESDLPGYRYAYRSSGEMVRKDIGSSAISGSEAITYTINYQLDGGIPEGQLTRTANYDTQISIGYPTRSGYDFKGWTATGTLSGAQYKNGDRWSAWDGESIVLSKSFCYLTYEDGSAVTLTANWEQTTYNISWNNLNGGSGTPSGGTASAAIGDKFTLATLIGAEKIGYTFMGWSYDKVNIYTNASGKFNEELAAAADSNNTVQMYALWNPITYELWYNYNGNTQQQYVKITVRYDEEINVEHLDRTGYSFDGWTSTDASATTSKYSTDGDEWNSWYDPSTVVNASYFKNLSSTQDAIVHMVATYTPVTYHVLYDANGGTGAAPTDTAAYNVGDKFTLASYETLIGTNGEKSIIGWSMDRNANAGSSITVFNETVALAADSSNIVTFYAIWVSNGCLIKVDLGDATATYIPSGWKHQQETKYYVKQVEYGSPVREVMADWDNVTISKEGYVFTSWNYSATTAITDVLVTCNFEKIHVPKYCLIVDLGDATSSAIPMGWEQGSGNVFFKEFMTAVPVEEALTDWDNIIISRGGYIFSSWGEPTVLTVQEIIVTCNFAKVTVNDDSSVRFEVEDGSSMSLTNYSVSELKERASTRDVTLTVDCSGSTIVFDRGSILALNGGGKLSVNEVDRTMLPESIRQQIKDAPIYEIEFGSNTYFGEGKVTVTLPYTLKSTEDPDDIRIYYLKDGIVAEKLDCTYENGKVTFTTNHFSAYAVVNEPAENSSSTDNSLTIAIIGGIVGAVIGSLAVIAAVMIAKKRKV